MKIFKVEQESELLGKVIEGTLSLEEKVGRDYFAKAPKGAEDMQALFADLIPIG